MKIDLTKEDLFADEEKPRRPVGFVGSLRANWLVLAGILAVYLLFVAGAFAFKRPMGEGQPMDIAFIFDTTGSMQDEMTKTVNTARRFVDTLSMSRISWRLALVAFGAREEPQVIRDTIPFTDDVDRFRQALSALQAVGGGDEDQVAALNHALTTLQPRQGVDVIYLLITDEPYTKQSTSNLSFAEIEAKIKDAGIRVYAVTASEDVPSTEDFKRLANETGGKWYDIQWGGDFTDILAQIAEDIATSIVR